jgi:hypothetical protein
MAIIAVFAVGIVALNQEQSLVTANELVRFGFFIAIAFAGYLLWRDFGRREIGLWPTLQQRVFYASIALLLVDLGWFYARSLSGRNLLVFFAVAAACIYAAVRIWRDQHRLS